MFGLFKKLFHKEPEKEFDPFEKFRCKVYAVESGRYLGEVVMDYNEYKQKLAFDTGKRYVRITDED